jgi:hypothetical protein
VVLAAIVLAPAAGCLVVLLCAALLRAATSVARPWQVALPTAAALLATYGCIAIATARQEEVVRSGHVRLLERGGLYLAELQGTTWPGRAR